MFFVFLVIYDMSYKRHTVNTTNIAKRAFHDICGNVIQNVIQY